MILIVVFSYNRAMQLDFLLKSIFARFSGEDFIIKIIYHTTGNHKYGYRMLKIKYQEDNRITFCERESHYFGLFSYLPTLYSWVNLKRFIKYSILFNEGSDNFKKLLESILKKTNCKYVIFNTDDGFYYDDVKVPLDILSSIERNPLHTSYRLYVGENLEGFPKYIRKYLGHHYKWDYYFTNMITHWTFPFSVDGTIYHARTILSILSKVSYHNPTTLEHNVVRYVMKRKLLKEGISPKTSKLVCTKLNRVAKDSSNPSININNDYLNEKFLEGFELEIELPKLITNANLVPSKVNVVNGNQKITVYNYDANGMLVQSLLGIEGVKSMD